MALSALRQACSVGAARLSAPVLRPVLAASAARSVKVCAAEVASEGDTVTVQYTGTLDDGMVFDSSKNEGREPLEFVIGAGQVIKGFDKVVTGLAVGGTNKLRVAPEDAYGSRNDQLVGKFSREAAPKDIEEGMQVQLSNGMPAIVMEVTETEVTIDANHMLADRHLTFEVELVTLKKSELEQALAGGAQLEKMTFAGGCFWGPELAFQRVPGVVATEVGYTNGQAESPTYEQVCSGGTGHTEAIQVTYDTSATSVDNLLEAFWTTVKDPTQVNGQGGDRGTQYRTGIYFHNEDQRVAAQASLDAMNTKYNGKVATELKPVDNYNTAEDYHQQYLSKGGRNGQKQSAEKGCKDDIRCYG